MKRIASPSFANVKYRTATEGVFLLDFKKNSLAWFPKTRQFFVNHCVSTMVYYLLKS